MATATSPSIISHLSFLPSPTLLGVGTNSEWGAHETPLALWLVSLSTQQGKWIELGLAGSKDLSREVVCNVNTLPQMPGSHRVGDSGMPTVEMGAPPLSGRREEEGIRCKEPRPIFLQ